MQSDRLMIWRFASAPEALKALHTEPHAPEWAVLIPRALAGADIDEVILRGSKPGQLARYETPDGDIVYIGTSKLDRLTDSLATLARPAAMTAIHSKRR